MIGIAQIGVGYWGRNLLRNFSRCEGARVTAVCDADQSVRARVAATYPGIHTSESVQDTLSRSDVDAVVIATGTPQHFDVAYQALKCGKHVFVEKPMTQTSGEARILLDEASRQGKKLMVGHLLMYHPAFEYVKDLIREGQLGDVYYTHSLRVNLGIIRQTENAFESLGPHDISIALEFISSLPVAVSAQAQAYLQPGVEDVAFATIFFEDGKLAHLHTSWLDPQKSRRVTVVGSRRMAVIDDMESAEKVRLYDKGVDISTKEGQYVDFARAMTVRSGDIKIPRIDMQEPLLNECRHFISCIQEDTTPRSDGNNGYQVVQILEAAVQSMRNGNIRIDL